jgi:hypothetical protein
MTSLQPWLGQEKTRTLRRARFGTRRACLRDQRCPRQSAGATRTGAVGNTMGGASRPRSNFDSVSLCYALQKIEIGDATDPPMSFEIPGNGLRYWTQHSLQRRVPSRRDSQQHAVRRGVLGTRGFRRRSFSIGRPAVVALAIFVGCGSVISRNQSQGHSSRGVTG